MVLLPARKIARGLFYGFLFPSRRIRAAEGENWRCVTGVIKFLLLRRIPPKALLEFLEVKMLCEEIDDEIGIGFRTANFGNPMGKLYP